jgi:hypothetical protein
MKLLEEKINTAVSLRNILFATDFSAISFRYGSMVHVAHVVPTSKFPMRPGAVDPSTIGSIMLALARAPELRSGVPQADRS